MSKSRENAEVLSNIYILETVIKRLGNHEASSKLLRDQEKKALNAKEKESLNEIVKYSNNLIQYIKNTMVNDNKENDHSEYHKKTLQYYSDLLKAITKGITTGDLSDLTEIQKVKTKEKKLSEYVGNLLGAINLVAQTILVLSPLLFPQYFLIDLAFTAASLALSLCYIKYKDNKKAEALSGSKSSKQDQQFSYEAKSSLINFISTPVNKTIEKAEEPLARLRDFKKI